jgi:hypothetical protein
MDNDDYDNLLEAEVDDIISQIRNQTKLIDQTATTKENLKKEDLEEFVIANAGNVVRHSLEMVEKLKPDVMTATDSKLIESVSELIKATTSAIDALSKLKIADDKIKAQKEITQMNIQKKANADEDSNNPKLTLSRNDILELLTRKGERSTVSD